MAHKTKFSGDAFKLQVYTQIETVEQIDIICKEANIYRSNFVSEAIDSLLSKVKYQKILAAGKRKRKAK